MKYIRVISDPQPVSQAPEFVKKAYVGLCLEVSEVIPPADRECFPQGFFIVDLHEFMRKMKTHNLEAYTWLSTRWGEIDDTVQDTGFGIGLVFPFDCCFECDGETIQ